MTKQLFDLLDSHCLVQCVEQETKLMTKKGGLDGSWAKVESTVYMCCDNNYCHWLSFLSW